MEEDERKETFLRDKYGDRKEWVVATGIFLIIGGIILFIIGICVGIYAIQDKYEVKTFNRMHETNYTYGEWFWGENTIKNYHTGTIENKNYQVDLNIKNLPIELEGSQE